MNQHQHNHSLNVAKVRRVFKYEYNQLHNFLLICATTKCYLFLERTICRLLTGTKHKETNNIVFEFKDTNTKGTLIY